MKNIDEILKDVYAIEPELVAKEAELRKIITELIAAKPDTKFDESFARTLRERLMQAHVPVRSPYYSRIPFFVGGVVVALIAIFVLIPKEQAGNLAFNQEFDTSGKSAFGALSPFEGLGKGGDGVENAATSFAETAPSVAQGGAGIATDVRIASPLIYPDEFEVISYVYTGEEFSLDENEGVVYRRKSDAQTSTALATSLAKMNFGLLDFGRFSNLKLQHFEIAEDKTNGYSINVNMLEGMISINANYPKWPSLQNPAPLTREDLPKNSSVKDMG